MATPRRFGSTTSGSGRVSLAGLLCTRPGQPPRLIYRTRLHHGRAHEQKGFTEADYARLLDGAHQPTWRSGRAGLGQPEHPSQQGDAPAHRHPAVADRLLNSLKGGGAAVGASLATLIFLSSFAAWAKITASSSWRLPAYSMLTVIGFPVAFGLLLLALERWTDWWDEFLGPISLVATLVTIAFLADWWDDFLGLIVLTMFLLVVVFLALAHVIRTV